MPRPGREPGGDGLVADAILGQRRAVVLDALPEPLDPVGIVGLEVGDGLGDGPRQAEQVDRLGAEPALRPQLARQLVAVQLLDRADHVGGVDAVDVDDLGLHGGLDRLGQRLDRCHRDSSGPRPA